MKAQRRRSTKQNIYSQFLTIRMLRKINSRYTTFKFFSRNHIRRVSDDKLSLSHFTVTRTAVFSVFGLFNWPISLEITPKLSQISQIRIIWIAEKGFVYMLDALPVAILIVSKHRIVKPH